MIVSGLAEAKHGFFVYFADIKFFVFPEVASAGCLSDQQSSDPVGELCVESQKIRERNRTKLETCGRGDRRKTWPERRRERREVKRLRREAQARRQGGTHGRPTGNRSHQDVTADPLMSPLQCQDRFTPTAQKKRAFNGGGKRNRKGREMGRW